MKESEIEHFFTYHAPTPDSIEKLKTVRDAAKMLAKIINLSVPECADKNAAFRLLRETVMTANAGIVLNQKLTELEPPDGYEVRDLVNTSITASREDNTLSQGI